MSLDALEGCAKKPIKIVFFEHPLARCRRNRKKQKKQEEKKRPRKCNTHFLGGLENGQEVVPPFFSRKNRVFQNPQKPIFIVFPEKMGGNHFFQNGYVTRRTDLEGQKK